MFDLGVSSRCGGDILLPAIRLIGELTRAEACVDWFNTFEPNPGTWLLKIAVTWYKMTEICERILLVKTHLVQKRERIVVLFFWKLQGNDDTYVFKLKLPFSQLFMK